MGARKSEILGLQWAWIDADYGRANLPDSKTGEKILVFLPSAMAELRKLPRIDGNPYVIVGAKLRLFVSLKAPWFAIREPARLRDVRIDDLLHSFASVGAAGGTSHRS